MIGSPAWLKSCADFAVVATAPMSMLAYTSALVPAAECRLLQKLFGFEAQLCAFEAMLREGGAELFFAPAPELFTSSESYRHLAQLSGKGPTRIIHIRFGMARHARLLKHAENLFALAERHVCLPLTPSPHPFATGNVLPAGVSRVLVYGEAQPSVTRIGGGTIPCQVLPPAYVSRDIEAALKREGSLEAGAGRALENSAGLYVRSFAEFQPSSWLRSDGGEGPGGGSTDWRRVLALTQLPGMQQETSLGFILIPWNLAHPASIVPDLVLKMCRSGNLLRAGYRPVLFPYNESGQSAQAIEDLVARTRAALHATSGALGSVFLARLRSLGAAWMLSRLFSLAWVEASDPERSWTAARLGALDIRTALVGAASPEPDEPYAAFSLPADEVLPASVSDQFGDRAYVAPSLSTRALATLVTRSLAEVRSASGSKAILQRRALRTILRPIVVPSREKSGATSQKGDS